MADQPGRRRPKQRVSPQRSRQSATPETERQSPHQVCEQDTRDGGRLQIDRPEHAQIYGDPVFDSGWHATQHGAMRIVRFVRRNS